MLLLFLFLRPHPSHSLFGSRWDVSARVSSLQLHQQLCVRKHRGSATCLSLSSSQFAPHPKVMLVVKSSFLHCCLTFCSLSACLQCCLWLISSHTDYSPSSVLHLVASPCPASLPSSNFLPPDTLLSLFLSSKTIPSVTLRPELFPYSITCWVKVIHIDMWWLKEPQQHTRSIFRPRPCTVRLPRIPLWLVEGRSRFRAWPDGEHMWAQENRLETRHSWL